MEEKIGDAATWLHFFAGAVSQDAEKIRRSLANAGVDAQPLASGTAACPGIVVFDTLSPGLCEFLRETSRNGAERVLAVALPGSAVHAADAGAADAFLWDRVRDTAHRALARRRLLTAISGGDQEPYRWEPRLEDHPASDR